MSRPPPRCSIEAAVDSSVNAAPCDASRPIPSVTPQIVSLTLEAALRRRVTPHCWSPSLPNCSIRTVSDCANVGQEHGRSTFDIGCDRSGFGRRCAAAPQRTAAGRERRGMPARVADPRRRACGLRGSAGSPGVRFRPRRHAEDGDTPWRSARPRPSAGLGAGRRSRHHRASCAVNIKGCWPAGAA
jgi:hypothetical protein